MKSKPAGHSVKALAVDNYNKFKGLNHHIRLVGPQSHGRPEHKTHLDSVDPASGFRSTLK